MKRYVLCFKNVTLSNPGKNLWQCQGRSREIFWIGVIVILNTEEGASDQGVAVEPVSNDLIRYIFSNWSQRDLLINCF